MRATNHLPPPPCVPWQEAAERLGCGKSKIFELLRYGRLKRAKRIGRGTMITVDSLLALERELCGEPAPQLPPSVTRRPNRHRTLADLRPQE